MEDLARLVAQLLLLVRLERTVVDDRPRERYDVEADGHRVDLRLGHVDRAAVDGQPRRVTCGVATAQLAVGSCTLAARAAHGLVARHVQPHQRP